MAMPRERRESPEEEERSSSVRLRERRREEGEEDGIAWAMASLSCWRDESLGMSILRISLESKDLTLSFMVAFDRKKMKKKQRSTI